MLKGFWLNLMTLGGYGEDADWWRWPGASSKEIKTNIEIINDKI
jgi:hypothetical protein